MQRTMISHHIKAVTIATVLMLSSIASAQGALVQGTVLDIGGMPVPNVAVEVAGLTLVPAVVTDLSGFFSAALPSGVQDIAFLPAVTSLLPMEVLGVTVPFLGPAVNLGTITLQPGFPISGSVLNSSLAPVSVADINVYDQMTGTKLWTPNDTTDLFGNFTVVAPAGTFRVRVRPPPGVLLVAEEVRDVVVAAPVALPVFSLAPGVILTGTVVSSATLMPIPDVDLDVDDAVTGQRVITPGDNTDGNGVFTVVVPVGTFDISFEPAPGFPFLAEQLLGFTVPASAFPVSTGVTSLDGGFFLTGTVIGPGGVSVDNADIDVDTALGNVRILTPGDNTDSSGVFTVVVPAGTYTVTIEPPAPLGLVGAEVTPVTVVANTTVPATALQPGVVVSGTILGWNGAPEFNADIDIIDPMTGAEIVTPSDNTNSLGQYSVIVPPGTWTFRVQSQKLSLSMDATIPGLVVGAAPVTFNQTMALVPVGCFVGPDQQAAVTQGTSVPITVAWFNPALTPVNATVELMLKDPAGVENVIVPPIPLVVPPLQIFLLASIAIPIPTINPAHAGLPFQLILRFRDPVTGAEWDSDRSRFVIQ